VEHWQRELAREEEMGAAAPRTRKAAALPQRSLGEAERIWLVRVGERTYFSDETEKITRQLRSSNVAALRERREAALRLWFKVGLDIEASLASAPVVSVKK
jgi:hypothetical protein